MFYGEWLIAQWFEMEFANQAGSSDPQKGVEQTMRLLEWSWDFKNCLLVGVLGLASFNYISSNIENYYNSFIAGGYEEVVIRTGIEAVFTQASPRRLNGSSHPMLDITTSIVDLAMIFDLF